MKGFCHRVSVIYRVGQNLHVLVIAVTNYKSEPVTVNFVQGESIVMQSEGQFGYRLTVHLPRRRDPYGGSYDEQKVIPDIHGIFKASSSNSGTISSYFSITVGVPLIEGLTLFAASSAERHR